MKKRTAPQKNRSGLVAALDIGTTKVCCLIAKVKVDASLEIVGVGHQVSNGVRSGAVIDLEAAEQSIRSAVEQAEKMAGENIRAVAVNVTGGRPRSRLIAYEITLAGHAIGDADIKRLMDPVDIQEERARDREILHAIPVGYSIDGNRGVRDPRGMYGQRLAVNMHLVSAEAGAMRNVQTAVSSCHLDVTSRVATAYASGLGSLRDDQRKLGATLIDMGGGTTSIATFFDNELVYVDQIPVGGVHVTNDIALGLSTPIIQAERMKTLWGAVIAGPSDDREVIDVPVVGEEQTGETTTIARSMLVGIIRPRLEETFEFIRDRLEAVGLGRGHGPTVVLTGGASQLPGVADLAATVLETTVRPIRPRGLSGLADAATGPAFSTCIGLLHYAVRNPQEVNEATFKLEEEPTGRLARIGHWIRENL